MRSHFKAHQDDCSSESLRDVNKISWRYQFSDIQIFYLCVRKPARKNSQSVEVETIEREITGSLMHAFSSGKQSDSTDS